MGGPPQFPNGGQGPMGPGSVGNVPQPGQRGQAEEPPPRPGLQLGPPGRWWDDKSMVKNLKLRPDQQARMDAIFEQNRSVLLSRLEGVQQVEAQMEELSKSPVPDESALFALTWTKRPLTCCSRFARRWTRTRSNASRNRPNDSSEPVRLYSRNSPM